MIKSAASGGRFTSDKKQILQVKEDKRMERYIYNENNGLWYELHGDYYLPCLALPDDKEEPYIGIWGGSDTSAI